jgi:hypothetical protein
MKLFKNAQKKMYVNKYDIQDKIFPPKFIQFLKKRWGKILLSLLFVAASLVIIFDLVANACWNSGLSLKCQNYKAISLIFTGPLEISTELTSNLTVGLIVQFLYAYFLISAIFYILKSIIKFFK